MPTELPVVWIDRQKERLAKIPLYESLGYSPDQEIKEKCRVCGDNFVILAKQLGNCFVCPKCRKELPGIEKSQGFPECEEATLEGGVKREICPGCTTTDEMDCWCCTFYYPIQRAVKETTVADRKWFSDLLEGLKQQIKIEEDEIEIDLEVGDYQKGFLAAMEFIRAWIAKTQKKLLLEDKK